MLPEAEPAGRYGAGKRTRGAVRGGAMSITEPPDVEDPAEGVRTEPEDELGEVLGAAPEEELPEEPKEEPAEEGREAPELPVEPLEP